MSPAVEERFGHPAHKAFVLQDRKRLPARFFALGRAKRPRQVT